MSRVSKRSQNKVLMDRRRTQYWDHDRYQGRRRSVSMIPIRGAFWAAVGRTSRAMAGGGSRLVAVCGAPQVNDGGRLNLSFACRLRRVTAMPSGRGRRRARHRGQSLVDAVDRLRLHSTGAYWGRRHSSDTRMVDAEAPKPISEATAGGGDPTGPAATRRGPGAGIASDGSP